MALYFKILSKILFLPESSFEELKGNVNAQDGFIIFLFISVLSVLTFGIIGGSVNTPFMAVPFGFGSLLSGANTIVFFTQEVLILLLSAGIANKIALRMGGNGNFSETFAFFCYAKIINFLKAIISSILAIWIFLYSLEAIELLSKGIEPSLSILNTMPKISQFFIIVFIIWLIWIQAGGIAVAHNIKKSRGILVSIISFLAAMFLVIGLFVILRALI